MYAARPTAYVAQPAEYAVQLTAYAVQPTARPQLEAEKLYLLVTSVLFSLQYNKQINTN